MREEEEGLNCFLNIHEALQGLLVIQTSGTPWDLSRMVSEFTGEF